MENITDLPGEQEIGIMDQMVEVDNYGGANAGKGKTLFEIKYEDNGSTIFDFEMLMDLEVAHLNLSTANMG